MTTGRPYRDSTFTIDVESITIHRYYFPIGTSKTIRLDQIRSVSARPTNIATRWRLWGSSNFRNWLPLELGRPKKRQLIELDIGKRIRPTITPDDPERTVALLKRPS